jgi:DNA-binding transcriptional ArsR family regulator
VERVTNKSHLADPSEEADVAVFRALADPTRREILDRLFERDGQSLGEIEAGFGMSRFGVMKHLRVLEGAGLVTTHRVSRSKLHYLNAVPIRELHDRWIHKFAAGATAALLGLKADVEKGAEMAATETASVREENVVALEQKPSHVFAIFMRATREQLWEALTNSEYTLKYYYASTVESEWRAGAPFVYRIAGQPAIVGEVIESTPPEKLICTFDAQWDDDVRADPPSRITWILEEAGPGVTKLTVVHDGFESETATFAQIAGGMPFILSGLKTLLETGAPLMQGQG